MMTKENIEAESAEIRMMYEVAKEIKPDLRGTPSKEVSGKLKKWYKYDAYGDIVVELYENGALLINSCIGYREWYGKANIQSCFNKAKTLGGRNKKLSKMLY